MVSSVVLALWGGDDGQIRPVLRVVLYGLLAGGIAYLIRILLRSQRRQDQDDERTRG